jgi:hypothetical protein
MREIRLYGSEGGGTETNRSFLPLSIAQGETLGPTGPGPRIAPTGRVIIAQGETRLMRS